MTTRKPQVEIHNKTKKMLDDIVSNRKKSEHSTRSQVDVIHEAIMNLSKKEF